MWENPKTDLWSQIIDSSLPQKKLKSKRIFHHLNRAPNEHCVRSAGGLKKTWRGVRLYKKRTSRLSYTTTTVFAKLERRWSYFFPFWWNPSRLGGNKCGAKTFLSSLFRVTCSKSNITGKPLARYTFCESFLKKTVGCICVVADLAGHFWKIVSWYSLSRRV